MRFFILISFVTILISPSEALILNGLVVDSETQEPLPYAHIDVLNKNIGIISRENGEFYIDLKEALGSENLSFSMIGYETKSFLIEEVEGEYLKVSLKPKTYMLQEVEVRDSEIINLQKFGRYKPTKTTTGHSGTDEFGWGGEWGLLIYNDDKTYQIQDINFHLRFNTVDSVLFRIHIYNISEGLPDESVLNKEIFVKSYKRDKWITKDFDLENLTIDEDVIVTFELVRIWYSEKGENQLFFTHGDGYERGHSYFRNSSFDRWTIDERPPITLFITGRVF